MFFQRMSEQPSVKVLTEKRDVNDDRRLRALGLLPLLFFIAQGIHYWRSNELGHMLWMCNIGNLLMAVGLFFNQPAMIRAPAIWTIPGLVMWLLLVVRQWGLVFASVLAHVGGFVVGMVALRLVGVNRRAWLYALVWYFVVQFLSRLTTPVDFNVNASQTIYQGWDHTFNAYWKFWAVMSLLVGIVLWFITLSLNKLWPSGLEEGS